MKTLPVKSLMVPLSEYATVSEEATLFEAVIALEESQKAFHQSPYPHRAILVFDKDNRIVGKLNMLDVLKGLEPRYERIAESKGVSKVSSRFGLAPDYIRSLIQKYGLWQRPMESICEKASEIKVKDIMHTPTEGEYLPEDATLNEAIHQFIMGQHQSLLVVRKGEIAGILRLTDVFNKVCESIKTCQV